MRPDANLEADVLAAVVRNPERYARKLFANLEDEDFTTVEAKAVFGAIVGVAKRDGHEAIAPATVSNEMRRMGTDERWMLRLLDADLGLGEVGSFEPKCRRLREIRLNRFLNDRVVEIMQANLDPSDVLDAMETLRHEAIDLAPLNIHRSFADLCDDLLAELEYDAQHQDDRIKTGIPSIDRHLSGGFAGGWLVVVGARTGVGKTMFATQMAAIASRAGQHCVYVAIEETPTRIVERVTRWLGRIGRKHIPIDDELVESLLSEATRSMTLDVVHLSDLNHIVGYLRDQALEREGVAAAFIDYAGLINAGDFESKVQEIGEITQTLKLAAMELGFPIVLLAQVNRSPMSRTDKRPLLSDLRDSGSLEQDSDVVLFLHHDFANPAAGDLVMLAKNRYGPPGEVPARFNYPLGRIEELRMEDLLREAGK